MLDAIYTSPESDAPTVRHTEIEAIAGRGLRDDRYATGRGYYSGVPEWDAHVTLIQREPFDALAQQKGVILDPCDLRRNLVTAGFDLGLLLGRVFRIGPQAVFRTRKEWPPCAHIVRRSGRREIFQYLARSSGLGADVLIGGRIAVGDAITLVPSEEAAALLAGQ